MVFLDGLKGDYPATWSWRCRCCEAAGWWWWTTRCSERHSWPRDARMTHWTEEAIATMRRVQRVAARARRHGGGAAAGRRRRAGRRCAGEAARSSPWLLAVALPAPSQAHALPPRDARAGVQGRPQPGRRHGVRAEADKLFFTEKNTGAIRVILNGQLLPTPCVNLDVVSDGERGALGLVLDPDYRTNHSCTSTSPNVRRSRTASRASRCATTAARIAHPADHRHPHRGRLPQRRAAVVPAAASCS